MNRLLLVVVLVLGLTACVRPAPKTNHNLDTGPVALEPASLPLADGSYLVEPVTGYVWLLSSDPFARVTWSRDAATLLISHEPRHNRHEANVIDVKSMKGTRLSGPGELNLYGASLSPDGKLVGYMNPQMGLQVAKRDGTLVRNMGIAYPTGEVRWSQDGNRILVTGAGQEMVQVHVVTDLATGKNSMIGEARWSWLALAPDGKRVALAQMDKVFIQELDSAARVEIPWVAGPLAWSGDGKYLASNVENFGPNAVGSTLMVKEIGADGPPKALADTLRFIDWGPDSRQIAYISNGCRTKEYDLYTVQADTGEQRRLTNSPTEMKHMPKWSPVGDMIAYATAGDLRVFDLATGRERVLLRLDRQPRVTGWSPDGRYLTIGFWEYGVSVCKEE